MSRYLWFSVVTVSGLRRVRKQEGPVGIYIHSIPCPVLDLNRVFISLQQVKNNVYPSIPYAMSVTKQDNI